MPDIHGDEQHAAAADEPAPGDAEPSAATGARDEPRDRARDDASDEQATDTSGADPITTARNASATRDHLANERTLLAWSRTGIAVMGLGFVVARFGLLLRDLGGHLSHPLPAGTSTVFGTVLVLAGSALLLLALLRYLRAGREIDAGIYRWSPLLGTLLAGTLLVAGVLLAIYLLITP